MPWATRRKWSTIRFAGAVDTTPPAPAPYIVTIAATSSQAVTMTARIAYDPSGVQYYFDTNTPGAHDSGWIDTPTYTDANLVPSTRYQYRVKARDLSARHNETAWSDWAVVMTQTPADTTPPTPNPMGWDPNGLPRELYGGGGPFDYYADMTALTATDASGSGPVLLRSRGLPWRGSERLQQRLDQHAHLEGQRGSAERGRAVPRQGPRRLRQ